jgi:hypothetical protein
MLRADEPKANRPLSLLEFSIRSASQAYGREYVLRVLLRHPLRALRGVLAYARLAPKAGPGTTRLVQSSEDAFLERAVGDGPRLLVGTGFCQKPLRAAGSAADCPAGRFNHACLYLARLELGAENPMLSHAACAVCPVHVLGQAALRAGASFAVLTSALDIAQDILLPALEQRRFTRVLFAICPYSVQPMSLALLTCGLEGCLFPYASGACRDYEQWLRADRGDKPGCTVLAPGETSNLLKLLDAVAARRSALDVPGGTHYAYADHVYRPL